MKVAESRLKGNFNKEPLNETLKGTLDGALMLFWLGVYRALGTSASMFQKNLEIGVLLYMGVSVIRASLFLGPYNKDPTI